jgi:hypothetical protein
MKEIDFENIRTIAIESVDATIEIMQENLGNIGLQAYCQVAGVAFLRFLIANNMYYDKISFEECIQRFMPMLKKSSEAYLTEVIMCAKDQPPRFEL